MEEEEEERERDECLAYQLTVWPLHWHTKGHGQDDEEALAPNLSRSLTVCYSIPHVVTAAASVTRMNAPNG